MIPDSRVRLVIFAVFLFLVGAYVLAAPLAGRKDGDFVHLWVGGHLAARGEWSALYDADSQKRAIAAEYGALPDGLWAERNDRLGAFFYPPPAAMLYALVGWLPVRSAAVVQALINLGLGLLSAFLLARVAGIGTMTAAVLVLSFPSFFYAFVLGQNGPLTLAILSGAALLILRARDLPAGLVLGLLVYKPSWFAAALALPLLLGRFRIYAGMAIGVASVVVVTLPFTGIAPFAAWLRLSGDLAGLHRLPGYPLALQYSLQALARRKLGLGMLGDTVGAVLALSMLALSLWRARARGPQGAIALVLVAITLANPHMHHYDLLPILIGLAIALAAWPGLSRPNRLGLVALLAIHHAAFVIENALSLPIELPLPTLVGGAAWAWLAFSESQSARRHSASILSRC